jgi:hypothetical protein
MKRAEPGRLFQPTDIHGRTTDPRTHASIGPLKKPTERETSGVERPPTGPVRSELETSR